MLEHADGDDPVVARRHLAIVTQMEVHAVSQASRSCTRLGHLVLLDAQGNAGDIDPGLLGQIEAEPTPAGADVEYLQSRLIEEQLGGDMAFLGKLGLLKRHVRPLEIRAGVLAVRVEKKTVEAI